MYNATVQCSVVNEKKLSAALRRGYLYIFVKYCGQKARTLVGVMWNYLGFFAIEIE